MNRKDAKNAKTGFEAFFVGLKVQIVPVMFVAVPC
jgi:TRAP-type uncharacterized transport system fused permease subunit